MYICILKRTISCTPLYICVCVLVKYLPRRAGDIHHPKRGCPSLIKAATLRGRAGENKVRLGVHKLLYDVAELSKYEGEELELSGVLRQEMGTYLCIASNGIPPTVSKRYSVQVQCESELCAPVDVAHASMHAWQLAFNPLRNICKFYHLPRVCSSLFGRAFLMAVENLIRLYRQTGRFNRNNSPI